MQALDVIERLLAAARHPDITAVARYGPGLGPWGPTSQASKVKAITGVRVTFQSTATASLWEAVWPDPAPVPVPDMPAPSRRAQRLLLLAAALLDHAKPDQFRAWQLVTLPGLGLEDERGVMPSGLLLTDTSGKQFLLRATATGPTVGAEPAAEPFPDWAIPEEVRGCLQQANAASAELG